MAIAPRSWPADNLVDILPPSVSDPLAQHLETLREDATLASRDSANILFSLARIHEHSGCAGSAMALYDEANAATERAMRELGIVYDPEQMEVEANRVIELFDHGAVSEPLEPLELDMTLVFIVGMPRSRTTLVERILASHSAVVGGGELSFMQDCLMRLLVSEAVEKCNKGCAPGTNTSGQCCIICESCIWINSSTAIWMLLCYRQAAC